jgi:hypothetical protein
MRSLFAALAMAALLIGVTITLTPTVHAQSNTAMLTGTVSDPQGAVVAGAKIYLINVATNVRRQTVTNKDGAFALPSIDPGTYKLQAQHEGFASVEVPDIILSASDRRELQIKLKLGKAADSISVSASEIMVNTEAGVSTLVNQQFVKSMPLNGRTFQSLLMMTPGVVFTGEQGQLSSNGQRTNSNYFTVDGVSANIGVGLQSMYDQSASGAIPGFNSYGGTQNLLSLDAMEEVKVQTSNYSAQYGRGSGAQVSLVSRSGTNVFHGTLYDYLRNSATDANDWFSDNYGLKKTPSRQNNFGGTFGGPVRIPGLYNGTDKTFFFFNYEGMRLSLPQPAKAITVPAACLHNRPGLNSYVQALINAFPLPTLPDAANACDPAKGGKGQNTYTTSWNNFTNSDSYSV